MVTELIVVAMGGILTGLMFGVAFSQHRYTIGFYEGYHEALDYIDDQTILVIDEAGNPVPLTEEELVELTKE